MTLSFHKHPGSLSSVPGTGLDQGQGGQRDIRHLWLLGDSQGGERGQRRGQVLDRAGASTDRLAVT